MDDLAERVTQKLDVSWCRSAGAPRKLSLREAIEATALYLRHNITEELVAVIMGVSQPTISRILTVLTPILRTVTEEFIPSAEEAADSVEGAVVVVDGSQAPCWSWADHRELWSGKSGTTGHTFTVISNLDGDVLYVSEALPASAHDMTVLRETPTAAILATAGDVLADLGYEGSGYTVPAKKPKNGELLLRDKEFNTNLSRIRSAVERAIANIKTWRVLHTDYRRPLNTWEDSFEAIIGLYFFKLV